VSRARKYRNEFTVFEAGAECHVTFNFCKNRVIFTHAYAFGWPKLRAALADDDIAWNDSFAAILFHPKTTTR
jgi:hypothetical protein